ncbi:MAG: hypothetical protein KA059_01615 [Elusimicrobiales bacterium]|jgi:predicted transcriptional regulator of viral defense system|nr:hypothetical protein [Elusimicrobiales bacterium]NLH40113.1 hypothetical protein [Elusimicrobiota bacterium]
MLSKNIIKISDLIDKPYFTVYDISNKLGITIDGARVFCSRYVKKKLFIKIKQNYYCFYSQWDKNSLTDYFSILSVLRVPSYVSLSNALYYYGITTQMPATVVEGITLGMTKEYNINGRIFKYFKIKEKFYSNFKKEKNFFIAEKEKAFLDCIYLYSFGKYSLDLNAIDLNKIDIKKLKKLSKKYPNKTIRAMEKICRI